MILEGLGKMFVFGGERVRDSYNRGYLNKIEGQRGEELDRRIVKENTEE